MVWEWLLRELPRLVKVLKANEESDFDEGDLIGDTLEYLVNNAETAEKIYAEQNRALLMKIVKNQLYLQKAKHFANYNYYYHYTKIINVCETYGISPVPDNAYKISGIINDSELSIAKIVSILEEGYLHEISTDVTDEFVMQEMKKGRGVRLYG